MPADVLIINGGTIFQFWMNSEAATAWWDENVQEAPMLGNSHCVEHRYAHDIIDGLTEAGLEIKGI